MYVEDLLPVDDEGWKDVATLFNIATEGLNMSPERLRAEFKKLATSKKPTGTPTCPPLILRAKRAYEAIEEKISNPASGVEDNANSEREGSEEREESEPIGTRVGTETIVARGESEKLENEHENENENEREREKEKKKQKSTTKKRTRMDDVASTIPPRLRGLSPLEKRKEPSPMVCGLHILQYLFLLFYHFNNCSVSQLSNAAKTRYRLFVTCVGI